MRQSDLHGNVQSAAEMTAPVRLEGGRVTTKNGPKVNNKLALEKSGHMLGSLSIPDYRPSTWEAVTMSGVQVISRKDLV